jgi:outer membrane immunogenic protein
MRKLLLAAVLAGIASPALAQTANSPFTGPRVEALVGYDQLRSGNEDDDGVDTGTDEGDETLDGVAYGIGAGFDFDLGGFVAGVEGEFTESSGKQESQESIDVPIDTRVETGRDLYVGGRIGFLASPNALVYAKGGYTNTSIEADVNDNVTNFELDTDVDGWRLGAGVEYVLREGMFGGLGSGAFAKVEYRYSNYNTLDVSNDADIETDIDLDRHQVVAGIGFRF